jgi:hypothetical protein
MKWFNKDNTAGLDTTKVSYWIYKNGELKIFITFGEPFTFQGGEAEEIYKILTNKKEVL